MPNGTSGPQGRGMKWSNWGQEVKGHTRSTIALEAWQRHHSWSLWV